MINVRLPWPPQVNHYYTIVRGRKALSAKGRLYKTDAAVELMRQKAPRNLAGRLEVMIDAYPPDKRRRDIDNLCKPVLDALQDYGLFHDDSQVDDLRIRRMPKGGYLRVKIAEMA